jgi:hypothetical protein
MASSNVGYLLCNSAAPRLLDGRCGKKVIGFIAGRFGTGEAAGSNKFREHVQLLYQFVIKLTAALIAWEERLAIGWRAEGVPPHEHSTGSLALVQPQQKIGETDNGTGAAISRPPDRFRQCTVGAVGEVVAIHSEQWASGVEQNLS